MTLTIKQGNVTHPQVVALLEFHLQCMHDTSPPESVHALDLSALQTPEMTFWSAWKQNDLAGCGALKALDGCCGEIKSMRTSSKFLKQGIAWQLLEHVVNEARLRGYERLYLETGSQDYFAPARSMYEKYGFEHCGPFAQYTEDPNSVFMTLSLR